MADLHIKFLENLWESPMHSSKPPQLVFVEQNSGSAISLSDKAKLSLYKKSVNSGISADILEEVYSRGYNTWNESFGGSPDQFAFDRVNSFISGGFAFQLDEDLLDKKTPSIDQISKKFKKPLSQIRDAVKSGIKVEKEHTKKDEVANEIARDHLGERPDYYKRLSQMEKKSMKEEKDLKDACWKGYEAVGLKNKNGKKVPNCVPVKEARTEKEIHSAKHFKTKETVELQSTNPNDSDSRFDGTKSVAKVYKNATPGQSVRNTIKRVVRETIEEGSPAWQRKEGKSASGGLNAKGIASYRREHPGSKLSLAVTEKKPTGKRAKRRLSFCRRMRGMKEKLTSAETARDPDSRINKSLRKWNC